MDGEAVASPPFDIFQLVKRHIESPRVTTDVTTSLLAYVTAPFNHRAIE